MEIHKLLPKTSFVPFKARRLVNANVVYANLPLFHEYGYFREYEEKSEEFYNQILDYFAYIVPHSDRDISLVGKEEKEFLAERYGGAGILANGGGARCGLSGPFSLKGIGPAPVVGRDVDYWYSHGRMGLEEALTELFYSHIAYAALPNASSRVLAVIDTGGTILQRSFRQSLNPYDDDCKHVRAGIIVRETQVRPAHFARAFYFKPSQYMKDHHIHDHERVRHVIPFLPDAVGVNDFSLNSGQKFRLAIEEILSKSALQLAYSKVRRLMHGSLGLSNILVNGGWIDFGSATAVPAYEQLITAELQPAYWDEVFLFQKTAADMCFYVRKFQIETRNILSNSADFYHKFVNTYINHLRILFVEVTGIPLFLLKNLVNNEWYQKFGSLLLHVAHMENPKARISDWVLHAEQPSHCWKAVSLRYILQKFFYQYWIDCKGAPPNLPIKAALLNELWGAYSVLCGEIEKQIRIMELDRQALANYIAFNMVRQLIGIVPLYRGHMLNEVAEKTNLGVSTEATRNNIELMFERYNCLASIHYRSPVDFRLLIALNDRQMRLFFDIETNKYRLEIPQAALVEYGFSEKLRVTCFSASKETLTFSQKDGEENYIYTYINVSDDSIDLPLSEIALFDGKNTVLLLDFFPGFDHLYSAYLTAMQGLEIPPEQTWDKFLDFSNAS